MIKLFQVLACAFIPLIICMSIAIILVKNCTDIFGGLEDIIVHPILPTFIMISFFISLNLVLYVH